ncbi:MAG: glycosyltransferase [Mariprofundaceae bacterium]
MSFALFSYNQEEFIREAVRAALAQDYEPLEIVISDDCSTDKTFQIIEEEASSYQGPHKITLNRNEKNIGVCSHVNKMMAMCSGDFNVGAAGDDISFPDRVSRLVQIWRQTGCSVISSNAIMIDGQGNEKEHFISTRRASKQILWTDMISAGCSCVFGAGLSWDRLVYESFGNLPEDIRNEDQLMPFRGALLGGCYYYNQPLLYYRFHDRNISFRRRMSSSSLSDWLELRNQDIRNRLKNVSHWLGAINTFERKNISEEEVQFAVKQINSYCLLMECERKMISEPILNRFFCLFQRAFDADLMCLMKMLLLAVSPKLYACVMRAHWAR